MCIRSLLTASEFQQDVEKTADSEKTNCKRTIVTKLDTTALPRIASASGLSPLVNPQTLHLQRHHPESQATTIPTHQEEQYVSEEEPRQDHELYRDAETITDVCNSTDLPEVEIISLLEEQLPHYQLRADTLYGYDHDDWLHTPLIPPDINIDLTTEQIEETLKYFQGFITDASLFTNFSPSDSGRDAVRSLIFYLLLDPLVEKRMGCWDDACEYVTSGAGQQDLRLTAEGD
ncbi:Trafficking kinesin-binding protein 1 [Bagarius yarrelli]|uniref:Trafficking kinesin-binding protein 1 n=1 Tax=Bagarius yarrelli TaxID=175774 RepID=A0A556TQ75_BAGYA|nr:Trafficking kinesin-binding protein 1 [Bagarius yarrelli]